VFRYQGCPSELVRLPVSDSLCTNLSILIQRKEKTEHEHKIWNYLPLFFLFAIAFQLVDMTAGHGIDSNSFKGWTYYEKSDGWREKRSYAN